MYYPDELVEEIRMKNDIVDVISGYVRLQRKGGSHFGLCPFHNEKSPSFSVSQSKQMYYCFGCGAGGNVFTFLMEYEHYTFQEAIKVLAERAGVQLPEIEYSAEMKQKENRRAKLLEVNKEAAKYFYVLLRRQEGSQGMQYLLKRQLSEETIKKFGLGYASKYSDDLTKYLKSKGYTDELLAEANAFCKQEDLDVTVFSGAEVAWTYQTESALRRGSVPTLGSTDYVLLELWRDISLQEAKHAVRSLIRAGYCPVLAHVERYRCFTWFPQQAMRLREETGAWFQVNASTLLKPQGMLEKRLIRRLLSDGGLDVVASDAHGNAARPLNLRSAHAWLVQHTDADYARALTTFHGELE